MPFFKRKAEPESPKLLDSLADADEIAAREMRQGPDSSPTREMDANAMDRQAATLRRRAAKARRNGAS